MAANQGLLEALPVLALRSERDRQEEHLESEKDNAYDDENLIEHGLACPAARRRCRHGTGPDRPWASDRLFGSDVGRWNTLWSGRRRYLCLDQQERRHQWHQGQPRYG